MARKRTDESEEETPALEPVLAATRPPLAPPPREKTLPQPVFSFDRYFATLGKPAHHKAGMRSYLRAADLRSKKTVAEWDRLFANY
jgi:hypothetical protein